MKETIIRTWCDQQEAHPEADEPATEVPVLNTAGKPVTVDLCEPCEKGTTIVQARILGDRHGQPIGKRTRNRQPQPAPGPCADCGRTYATAQGLSNHRSRTHKGTTS